MEPREFYNNKIAALQDEIKLLTQTRTMFAWLRLAVIIGIVACCYFLLPFGLLFCLIPAILLLVLFSRLVFADLRNKSSIEHTTYLLDVNEDEVKALTHNYYHFAEGTEYTPKEHFYANDLDIFGHASLYQYVNRTSQKWVVAPWLTGYQNLPTSEIILERQEAIKELIKQPEWRQAVTGLWYGKAYKKGNSITFTKLVCRR